MQQSKRLSVVSLIVTMLATPSFATDPDPAVIDRQIVASKAYVDTKQDIIPAATEDYQSVLVDTDTDGEVGKRGILDYQTYSINFGPEDLHNDVSISNMIPEIKLIGELLRTLDWNGISFPAAINAYSTTFDTTNQHVNGNWPNDSALYLVRTDTFVNSLALKQNILPIGTAGSVVTYNGTNGVTGAQEFTETAIYSGPTAQNPYNAANDAGKIATAGFVETTKQDKITAGLVQFYDAPADELHNLPALVSYGTGTNNADGLLGNKVGILSYETLSVYDPLYMYDYAEADDFVPTVRLVANAIKRLNWYGNSNGYRNAIGAYSTLFGGTGWPGTGTYLINGEFLANALSLKQNILPMAWTATTGPLMGSIGGQTIDLGSTAGVPGQRYITAGGAQPLTKKSEADNVILYVNSTKTLDEFRISNFSSSTVDDTVTRSNNYIKGALVSLELLKDVYAALHSEITSHVPSGTPNTVANYGANGALGSGIATYDGSGTYAPATDANKIATAAAVETKQDKMVCAGYAPDHLNDPDYCWLWRFAE